MILHDPQVQEFAGWLLGSPESGNVALLVGWVAGMICGGVLSLVMSR